MHKPSDSKVRFLRMVKIVESGCHEWTSTLHRDGYGKFHYKGQQVQAHRVAYSLFVGEIPQGMMILHKCDNRKCVNPEHLYAGTAKQNMADKIARCRKLWGRMKYTQIQIDECKRLYASGMSQCEVAEKMNMDQTTVSRFVRGDYLKRS